MRHLNHSELRNAFTVLAREIPNEVIDEQGGSIEEIALRLDEAARDAKVEYLHQDPWTYCLLKIDRKIIPGVAKRCNYEKLRDKRNRETGEQIALARAIRHMIAITFGIEEELSNGYFAEVLKDEACC